MDAALGEFFEGLESSGVLHETVVVITSDHGEELLEHGLFGHGWTLYREALMIPLIVWSPGIAPRRVQQPAGLVDVAPTVLDLLGLEIPPHMEGASLVGRMRGTDAASPSAPRLSEVEQQRPRRQARLASLIDAERHLIVDFLSGERQIFDFAADPGELNDLSELESARLESMHQRLLAALARKSTLTDGSEEHGPLTVAEREQLRALGYLDD